MIFLDFPLIFNDFPLVFNDFHGKIKEKPMKIKGKPMENQGKSWFFRFFQTSKYFGMDHSQWFYDVFMSQKHFLRTLGHIAITLGSCWILGSTSIQFPKMCWKSMIFHENQWKPNGNQWKSCFFDFFKLQIILVWIIGSGATMFLWVRSTF